MGGGGGGGAGEGTVQGGSGHKGQRRVRPVWWSLGRGCKPSHFNHVVRGTHEDTHSENVGPFYLIPTHIASSYYCVLGNMLPLCQHMSHPVNICHILLSSNLCKIEQGMSNEHFWLVSLKKKKDLKTRS